METIKVDAGSDLTYIGGIVHDFGDGYKYPQVQLSVFNSEASDDTVIYLEVDEALAVSRSLRKAAKLARKGAK